MKRRIRASRAMAGQRSSERKKGFATVTNRDHRRPRAGAILAPLCWGFRVLEPGPAGVHPRDGAPVASGPLGLEQKPLAGIQPQRVVTEVFRTGGRASRLFQDTSSLK